MSTNQIGKALRLLAVLVEVPSTLRGRKRKGACGMINIDDSALNQERINHPDYIRIDVYAVNEVTSGLL